MRGLEIYFIYDLFFELYSRKSKIQIFHNIFLNTDVSLDISETALKCGMFDLCHIPDGSVSQFSHLGPRFYFIKCRNYYLKN